MYKETETTDFFLDNGVTHNKNVDYIFVVNVPDFVKDPIGFKPSEKFNNTIESVSAKVFYRDNTGGDFGGYSCVVDRLLKTGLIDSYDFFIFLNQTVLGPVLPSWSKNLFHWSDALVNLINEKDRLAGLSINCFYSRNWHLNTLKLPLYSLSKDGNWIFAPHVQTMLFATDRLGLNLAIDGGIFDYENIIEDKESIIMNKEVNLSEIMLLNNYNIASLLENAHGIDFRQGNFDEAWTDVWWDSPPEWNAKNDVHPCKMLFIKANRGTEKQKAFVSGFIENNEL